MSSVELASARPPMLVSLVALYRLLLRTQITVQRLLGIGALAALSIVIGLFARADPDPLQAAADSISGYGLGILVPLAALWLGTSAIGDLVEDKLLVYLTLKPVPRWQLPAAAILATASIVVPLTALPLTVATLVAGAGEVALATFLAASLAGLAYAGLFVAAGIWFRRAVWWGLVFVLIWENVVPYSAGGAARYTVAGWAASILGLAPGIDVERPAGSGGAAFAVLPAIAIAGWLVATWRYRNADID
jgi:ABC-2 type transport system permease protein